MWLMVLLLFVNSPLLFCTMWWSRKHHSLWIAYMTTRYQYYDSCGNMTCDSRGLHHDKPLDTYFLIWLEKCTIAHRMSATTTLTWHYRNYSYHYSHLLCWASGGGAANSLPHVLKGLVPPSKRPHADCYHLAPVMRLTTPEVGVLVCKIIWRPTSDHGCCTRTSQRPCNDPHRPIGD